MGHLIKFSSELSFGSQMLHFVQLLTEQEAAYILKAHQCSIWVWKNHITSCLFFSLLCSRVFICFFSLFSCVVLIFVLISDAQREPPHLCSIPHHFLPSVSLLSAIFFSIVFPEIVS